MWYLSPTLSAYMTTTLWVEDSELLGTWELYSRWESDTTCRPAACRQ